eukprot:12315428-Alexandrium_andersonii.AAC.1
MREGLSEAIPFLVQEAACETWRLWLRDPLPGAGDFLGFPRTAWLGGDDIALSARSACSRWLVNSGPRPRFDIVSRIEDI